MRWISVIYEISNSNVARSGALKVHKLSRCNRPRKAGISPVLLSPPGDFTIHKKKNPRGEPGALDAAGID